MTTHTTSSAQLTLNLYAPRTLRLAWPAGLNFALAIAIAIALLVGCTTGKNASRDESSKYAYTPRELPAADAKAAKLDKPNLKRQRRHYKDVWDRVRDRFAMPDLQDKYTERYEKWYAKHNRHILYLGQQADPYLYHIVEEIEKRNLPSELALLPAIESAYKPKARSHANAAGLWQFIASTGRIYGLEQNRWYDGRLDVVESTSAALDYLQDLHRDFAGDWFLALAAYNAGATSIRRALAHNKRNNLPLTYSALKLRTETRLYVRKLVALRNIVNNPTQYGLELPLIKNRKYFTSVKTRGQIDLATVTQETGIPLSELRRLNPAFKRRATAPDGPHELLVPATQATRVSRAIKSSKRQRTRLHWQLHNVARGESLSIIARKYKIDVDDLIAANLGKINGTVIHVGDTLQIPLAAQLPKRSDIVTAGAGNGNIIHTVRRGDTVSAISKRYNISTADLVKWNRIKDKNKLKLGQKIKIYKN